MMRLIYVGLLLSGVWCCSCLGSRDLLGNSVQGHSKCEAWGGQPHPLVVEWNAADRTVLERAVERGTVVVRYVGCDMEILEKCTAPGGYQYTPMSPRAETVSVRDERSLYAHFPVGAVGLEGKLKASGRLDVDMTIVGQYYSNQSKISPGTLLGNCDLATHFVTELTVGAFVFGTGASEEVGSGLAYGGAEVGGGRTRSKEVINSDGDPASCARSTVDDDEPPEKCGAPIRVALTEIRKPLRAKAIAAGWGHTCATTESGGVVCWGDNSAGQLGDGSLNSRLEPVHVTGLEAGVQFIAAGNNRTCAGTATGKLVCWGGGDRVPTPVAGLDTGVRQIALAFMHWCAVTSAGGVKCWEKHGDGLRGDGSYAVRQDPTHVTGLDSGVTSVSATWMHTCAVAASGRVLCWGRDETHLGGRDAPPRVDRPVPTPVAGFATGAIAVAAGISHTCALTIAREVVCWGNRGRLGDGSPNFGKPGFRGPSPVTGLQTGVQSISAGGEHTCAITAAETVKCWGRNSHGRLGDGTTEDRAVPSQVSGLHAGVVAVSAGDNHTCALMGTGEVKCWGANDKGQIGDGTTTERLTPVLVIGPESES
ncbi:MAG: hypothetical protein FWD57_12020 [Polyangiaceae bacterium]|nr:hypothetical protein [Polyangiaceae bacterium]